MNNEQLLAFIDGAVMGADDLDWELASLNLRTSNLIELRRSWLLARLAKRDREEYFKQFCLGGELIGHAQ